jgi:hypothetical protein
MKTIVTLLLVVNLILTVNSNPDNDILQYLANLQKQVSIYNFFASLMVF